MKLCRQAMLLATFLVAGTSVQAQEAAAKKPPTIINAAPTAQDWADIAKLPDWSGVWNPKITDQDVQVKTNPPPWTEKAAKQIEFMFAEERAGRPRLIFFGCF